MAERRYYGPLAPRYPNLAFKLNSFWERRNRHGSRPGPDKVGIFDRDKFRRALTEHIYEGRGLAEARDGRGLPEARAASARSRPLSSPALKRPSR